ncbi:hypothetical protein B2G71_17165 [Novosphingobium sp. PC22D]|nr:hypothetical protein B2G71_17165 [Novosphingobium sp. PC22D]
MDALADALERARLDVRPIDRDALDGIVADAEQAYCVSDGLGAHAVARGTAQAGWKIGLTSRAAMDAFGASEPMVGRLFADAGLGDGARFALASAIAPRLEGEIMLELAQACDPRADEATLLGSIARIWPAFEIADSRIAGWPASVDQAIADNACCGWHVRGPQSALPTEVDLSAASMVMTRDGETVATGSAADCLGGVLGIYRWFLEDSIARGRSLRPGDLVLTGALGPAVPLTEPGRYLMQIDGLAPTELEVAR